jgi:tRNA threonylcarbamoyladenosine biosynthesis protein TsaE
MWLLSGPVGAGKTTFVQGFVASLDPSVRVQSPSYALARTYPTSPPVVHIDLYRYLDAGADVLSLGIDELCDRPDAHVLLEWPASTSYQWAARGVPIYSVEITPSDTDAQRTIVVQSRI